MANAIDDSDALSDKVAMEGDVFRSGSVFGILDESKAGCSSTCNTGR